MVLITCLFVNKGTAMSQGISCEPGKGTIAMLLLPGLRED